MDNRLLPMLVCPLCKGPLELRRHQPTDDAGAEVPAIELVCHADRLAYPVRDGIPVMLEAEARAFDPEVEARATAASSLAAGSQAS